jgi:hypothetical protein
VTDALITQEWKTPLIAIMQEVTLIVSLTGFLLSVGSRIVATTMFVVARFETCHGFLPVLWASDPQNKICDRDSKVLRIIEAVLSIQLWATAGEEPIYTNYRRPT